MATDGQKFRVAQGNAIKGRNTGWAKDKTLRSGKIFRAGQIVVAGQDIRVERVDEMVLQGRIKPVTHGYEDPMAEVPTDNIPGVDHRPAISSKEDGPGIRETREGSKPVTEESPRQRDSIWDVDPKKLKDKDLDSLNAMILERDPNHTEVKTKQEGISVLSKDFGG